MNQWFEVTVSYKGYNDSGLERKVSEKYLFDAMSFTEAEARANEELGELKEVQVKKINPIKVSEIFLTGHGDLYFKCKINYLQLDEKTGKEKKTPAYIYVQAENTKNAEAYLTEGLKGTMMDWKCESISETKIMDVFKYDLEKASKKLEADEKETVQV